jgi:hypothetical protein
MALHVARPQHDREQGVGRRRVDRGAPAQFGEREALRGMRDQHVDHL